jgi:type IV pilus assembly protein PilY1
VVFVGTGAYLGVSDVSTTQVQTMYAIKDPLTTSGSAIFTSPRNSLCGSSTATNCFVRVTLTDASNVRTSSSTVTASFATMNGWFADMPETGERIDVDPVLYSGTLVYVSNTPSTSGACSTGGSSYINYVNYATGTKVPGAADSGLLLSPSGLSGAPVLSLTTGGRVVATTKNSAGETQITSVPTATTPGGTRRISWRRLKN